MSQQIDLQARPSLSTSSCKPIPTSFACAPKLQFSYSGSPDGVDTNLLILLHGRGKIVKDAAHTVMLDMDVLAGDSEVPFAKLAGTLQLPQTATLALRGPLIVPLLDEHEREWWNETDMMGMNVSNPDPSQAVKLLCEIVDELQASPYDWHAGDIHLFGFAQGGTLALETALRYSKAREQLHHLASVVSIQGPLLSLPSQSQNLTTTKVLYVYRTNSPVPSIKVKADITALQRAFTQVKPFRLREMPRAGLAMPNNKQEWEGIMNFWSDHLRSSSAWQRKGEVYEITGGREGVKLPSNSKVKQADIGTQMSTKAAGTDIQPVATTSTPAGAKKPKTSAPSGFKRGFLAGGL